MASQEQKDKQKGFGTWVVAEGTYCFAHGNDNLNVLGNGEKGVRVHFHKVVQH